MRRLIACLLVGLLLGCTIQAQEYTGITGMIHVPTAEMAPEGDARIGISYLNREFLPEKLNNFKGTRYHSYNHYLAITPFSWIELAYVCTLQKGYKGGDPTQRVGFYHKDRHFAVKVRPLKEGKYWPAIALGVQDPGRSDSSLDKEGALFKNYYIAATKHWCPGGHELGFHLAYRHYSSGDNRKWNGVVGGVTYRPAFASNCRAMVEYTGNDVNVGVDCLLWKHLFIQAALQNGRYFSGGLRFQMNLF